jgi:diguanylate cyclase (GGDEF)-like protein
MMIAIYNRFNTKTSCLYYQKDEALRLERLSMNDHLTGVMNRSGLNNVLSHQYGEKSLAVIAADINGLKSVNDTMGHEAGDRLIVSVATCLSEVFGNNNVFRTGGDEFIIIQYDHSEDECIKAIEKLRDVMNKANVSASLGYAYTSSYRSDFLRLQGIADKHMYEDKERFYSLTGKHRRV